MIMASKRKLKVKPGPKGPRLNPADRKRPFNTKLSPYIIDALNECDNMAATIEAALVQHLKIEPQ